MTKHPSNEKLQAYLDGELSMREGRELEAHLEACAGCVQELERLESLFSLIESLPDEQLEIDLAPGIVDAIQPRLPRLAMGELVVVGALALGMVIWVGSGELQSRIEDAIGRTVAQLEAGLGAIDEAATDLLARIPTLPSVDFVELGESVGSVLISPSVLWAVVGAALALWLIGNGLILRLGKDRNA